MEPIDIREAEARFDELLARVEAGEEILIGRDGVPVAVMAPMTPPPSADLAANKLPPA